MIVITLPLHVLIKGIFLWHFLTAVMVPSPQPMADTVGMVVTAVVTMNTAIITIPILLTTTATVVYLLQR